MCIFPRGRGWSLLHRLQSVHIFPRGWVGHFPTYYNRCVYSQRIVGGHFLTYLNRYTYSYRVGVITSLLFTIGVYNPMGLCHFLIYYNRNIYSHGDGVILLFNTRKVMRKVMSPEGEKSDVLNIFLFTIIAQYLHFHCIRLKRKYHSRCSSIPNEKHFTVM